VHVVPYEVHVLGSPRVAVDGASGHGVTASRATRPHTSPKPAPPPRHPHADA
jgi:hypothetical protein